MTYRLEPVIERIESSVVLIFPDGKQIEYSSGSEVCETAFDHKYVIKSVRATDNKIEIVLKEADSLNGDETFF